MPNFEHRTTAEVATALGISVRSVHRLILDGALVPVSKLPGVTGAYLFERADVERIASERAK